MSDQYSRRFSNIDRRTKLATKKVMAGWSTKSNSEQFDAMNVWLRKVSQIYALPTPTLRRHDGCNSGWYIPALNRIEVPHFSLITLFHEFRHAYQHSHFPQRMVDNVEDDARAWSLSLYRSVAPRTYAHLVDTGRVLHI